MQVTMGSSGSPSHLVLLFCVSAGKNGEELGSDEEQIVYLVYLLYDVYSNKVVSLQSHYVKPQPNDLTETILSEECREDTGLDENAVRNGQPLDFVLEELDRFLAVKGIHPEKGGRSFVFLTDGQCHVRQCLQHEACSKSMALPSYYSKFFDIRKEFQRHYNAAHVTDIKSMLDYLGVAGDQSVEFGIRNCQDMATIVSRLLNDGHTFGEPQIVNERLEGGICMKSEVVDDNTVVRARGLPWQSSDQDIARFFKGLNIAKGGVALCLSPQGRRNGEALIRFESQEHRDLALKRHKHHIGQRYIEVYKASGRDFINVAGGSNTEAQAFLSRGGQTIIRMRGLPFTATTAQVLEFFTREPNPCEVLDGEDGILFVHYPDGRSTGDAFVLFSSEEESLKALKKHRENMGSRYIELFKSTTAEVQQVLNRSMDPRIPEQPDGSMSTALVPFPSPAFPIHMPQNFITAGSQRDCLRVRNLHSGAQGEPSGEAFIQMDSENSAYLTALHKNSQPMIFSNKKRIIEVLQVSGDEMSVIVANSFPTLSPSLPPMMAQVPQVPQVPQLASIPPLPVASVPPVPVSLSQRPMIAAPNGMMTAPTLQLTASPLPSPAPAQLGTMPVAQLPQPLPAAAFPPAMTSLHQRPPYYSPMLFW
ncbi:RNA-binding protein fusilli-like isoform X2 [Babylonia areolata]|uniref:RNA-binding protein fusilli-like isoform X2 n=1 Tax=Babylonia areolata TaxID=304850 RepID=UPI003FD2E96B